MSWLLDPPGVGAAIPVFAGGAVIVAVFGSRLARLVDALADRTGWGEAITGAVVLAASTSLAGLIVSLVAAASGEVSLAISNSAGGIAAQTAFVVVADLVYRRANIEHAAASLVNLFNAFLLVALLALVVLAVAGPQGTLGGVHPATVLLVGFYLYGIRLGRSAGRERMWRPLETSETRRDVAADEGRGARLPPMLLALAGLTAMVGVGGFAVGRSGLVVVEATGLSGTVVGILLTSIATSLPELVTTVAAVRSGALTLAIGGLVGGNSFDVLFIGFADVAFRGGSLYERAGGDDVFVLGWTMLLVAVLGAGLVRRERRGIGFEGIGILVLYVAGAAVVVSMG